MPTPHCIAFLNLCLGGGGGGGEFWPHHWALHEQPPFFAHPYCVTLIVMYNPKTALSAP